MRTVLDKRALPDTSGPSPTVEDLLVQYAEILNAPDKGPDSKEAQEILDRNRDNEEFAKLAKVSLFVWKRLNKS